MRLLIVAFITVLLASCSSEQTRSPLGGASGQQDNGLAVAKKIAAHYGAIPRAKFELGIRVKAKDQDALNFTIHAWVTEDNIIRLRAQKLGFEFLDGLIKPDGSFLGILVRDKEVVQGNLKEMAAEHLDQENASSAFFSNLPLLVSEAKRGPLPNAYSFTLETQNGTTFLICEHEHNTFSRLTLKQDRGQWLVTEKQIIYDDAVLGRLTYKDLQPYDTLLRPKRLRLYFDQDIDTRFTLRALDAVPSFSPRRFQLSAPPDYPVISLNDFRKRLEAPP